MKPITLPLVALAVAMAAVVVVLTAKPGQALISCGEVASQLAPCLPYLTGGGDLIAPCCNGLKNIIALTATTADKQAACNCVKDAASRRQDIREDLAFALAAKCSVQLDIPISKTTDCASIK